MHHPEEEMNSAHFGLLQGATRVQCSQVVGEDSDSLLLKESC